MTNEEAIEILRGAIKKPNTEDGYLGQAITVAIEALEQQPCEDCISRQAAIEAMGEQPLNWTDTPEEIAEEMMWEDHIKALKELPSVTPARARGKWMTEHNKGYVQCSNCHTRVPFCKRSNFCPDCGAEMGGDINADSD